jgi:ATP-dependent Clp protease ATP-binding subunit ClpC
MQSNLTPRAQQAIRNAKKEAIFYNDCFVAPEHLLLGLLIIPGGPTGEFLSSFGVTEEALRRAVEGKYAGSDDEKVIGEPVFSQAARDALTYAGVYAKNHGHRQIYDMHILLGLLHEGSSLAWEYLDSAGITEEKVQNFIEERLGSDQKSEKDDEEAPRIRVEFIPLDMKKVNPSDLRYLRELRRRGLTPPGAGENLPPDEEMEEKPDPYQILSTFGVDLTKLAKEDKFDPLIGREKEIDRLSVILCRRQKNNPVLLGEAGVGKTAIVEGLAKRIVEGKVPEPLLGKKVFALDLSRLMAGTAYRGQFEEKVIKLLSALKEDGKTILFIDEMHTMLGAGSVQDSANDVANMLKPALSRGEFNCIGATTRNEYRRYVEKDAALERRFQPVAVEPPSPEETLEILRGLKARYEKFHSVVYSEETLGAIVKLSARYIVDRYFPDKAIDVLDEAGARAQLRRLELKKESPMAVTPRDVANVIAGWVNVPVENLEEEERQKLRRMEKELHKTIVGQNKAIDALSRALRRARADLRDPARPIGTFLALGPTGVGKSLMARALAKFLFNDENALITLDMSEYMEKFNVSRLFGSPPGYVGHEEGGQLTEKVRKRPFSVILLDEVEKAHPDVLHALLQVLENGRMTDSLGRLVDFRNTIIIMTSNLGAKEFQEGKTLGFGSPDPAGNYESLRAKLLEKARKTLRPEFINRLDDILIFQSLKRDELLQIVDLEVEKVASRLEDKNITLKLTPAAKQKLCDMGNTSRYGAREIRRVVESELEDRLAEAFLGQVIPEGSSVTVKIKEGEFVFETALPVPETAKPKMQ